MPNKNIFEEFTPELMSLYWRERAVPEQQTYLGAALFPSAYNPDLSLSWIRGRTPAPIALNPSAFDTEPPLRSRFGYEKITRDMPFFREALHVNEEEFMTLQRIERGLVNESYAIPVKNKIYNDVFDLIEAGRVQKEAMRMQLLGTGGLISVAGAHGAHYSVDYQMPEENKFAAAPGAVWSNTAAADPIEDLRVWRKDIRDRAGSYPTRVILSAKTWGYIRDNQKIKNGVLLALGTAAGTATTVDVNIPPDKYASYIRSALSDGATESGKLEFIVYDKVYKPHAQAPLSQYFPDDVIALLPSGTLGNTWWSDTPESLDAGNGKFETASVNDGIVVCRSRNDKPPLGFEVWAAMITLPSFERILDCGWAKVA